MTIAERYERANPSGATAAALAALLCFVGCLPLDETDQAISTVAKALNGVCDPARPTEAQCPMWGRNPTHLCIGDVKKTGYGMRCVSRKEFKADRELIDLRDDGLLFRRCPVGDPKEPNSYDGFQFWCKSNWCGCVPMQAAHRKVLVDAIVATSDESFESRDLDLLLLAQPVEAPSVLAEEDAPETSVTAPNQTTELNRGTAPTTQPDPSTSASSSGPHYHMKIRCRPGDQDLCDLNTHVCLGHITPGYGLTCVLAADLSRQRAQVAERDPFIRCSYDDAGGMRCDGFSFRSSTDGGWRTCRRFEDEHREHLATHYDTLHDRADVDAFLGCDGDVKPARPPDTAAAPTGTRWTLIQAQLIANGRKPGLEVLSDGAPLPSSEPKHLSNGQIAVITFPPKTVVDSSAKLSIRERDGSLHKCTGEEGGGNGRTTMISCTDGVGSISVDVGGTR